MPRDPRAFRTAVITRPVTTLAERFESAAEGFPVGSYRVEMSAEGKGGEAGPQHIRLVPPDKQALRLLVGTAHPADHTAQLMGLDQVNAFSREHAGEPTKIDPAEYAAFIAGATKCLEAQLFTVEHVNAVPRSAAGPSRTVLAVIGGVVAALLVLVVGFVAFR